MRTSIFCLLCLAAACRNNSTPTVTVPTAPSMVAATPGAGFVRVVWSDDSTDEAQFVIGRVELTAPNDDFDAAALTELTQVTEGQVVFRDTPTAGHFYAYGVAAQNAAGRSGFTLQPKPAVSPISAATGAPCQIAVPSIDDPDGDGLSSDIEAAGWTVRVNQNGMMQFAERMVQSAAGSGDSDGDGLCDGEERILRTDPNKKDTDGDGLDDDKEVLVWGSAAVNVDSDGDANGNPAFYDGSEVTRYHTSPTLSDTDGDGHSDYEEINQNSTNALVADLPQPKLELVGTVDVSLDITLANGMVMTNAVTQQMTRGSETSTNRTSSTATTASSETSVSASASVSAGFPDGVSASVSASVGQTDGYSVESSTSFEASSAQSARSTYEGATSRELSQGETITGGKLAVQLNILNAGTRTFELKDLVVTALARTRENPATFGSIATLDMPPAAQSVTLGDGQRAGPFRVEAPISANTALDLLSNLNGLVFKPAAFQLIDKTGTNFAFSVGEATSNRTALIVIDYGGDRDLETYRVATNVARVDGGKLAGLKMSDALAQIGLMAGTGYVTATNPRGVQKLTAVRGVAAQMRPAGAGASKFWAVIAAENSTSPTPVTERLLDATKGFDDLLLMPRDRVYLAYEADEDGDGLYQREERLYRTSDMMTDTDGDGLSDREEIREGWSVFSTLPYYANSPRVFPSPAEADADSDGLNDLQERAAGTDPNRADTDGDGLDDKVDPEPLRGVGRPYIHTHGTVANESPSDVVFDSNENVYVLGHGAGDFDGDGYIITGGYLRSAYLASYDATGRTRWVNELEYLPHNNNFIQQSSLVMGKNGHLYFLDVMNGPVSSLYPAAFPGVTADGLWLVELDLDGAVVSVHAVSGSGVGGFFPTRFAQLSTGDFVAIGRGNSFALVVLTFDATGAQLGTRSWAASATAPNDDLLQVDAAGSFAVVANNCQILVFDRTLAAQPTADVCGTWPYVTKLAWAPNGDFLVGGPYAVVSRFSRAGAFQWTNNPPGTMPAAYSLTVDRVGRAFAASSDGSAMVIRQITTGGTLGWASHLPTTAFYPLVMRVDENGNLYAAGQTSDGVGGRAPAFGLSDGAVLRNPQLLFP